MLIAIKGCIELGKGISSSEIKYPGFEKSNFKDKLKNFERVHVW